MLLNRSRAEKIMVENGVDALVASSPSNVLYTSDLCPYGRTFVLLPLDRDIEPAIVTPISCPIPVTTMSPPWIRDVRYYGEFYTETDWAEEPLEEDERMLVQAQESWRETKEADPLVLLAEILEQRGLIKGKIGVDDALIQPNQLQDQLGKKLPSVEVVVASHLFTKIRMVKTEEEITRIGEAVRITEKAWGTSLESVRTGMTERDFAYIFNKTILDEGGMPVSHMGMYGAPIAFGRRSAFVDLALPTDYRLKRGDLLRFDGGCSYKGYNADMARTAILGESNEKLTKFYDAIFEGEELALELAKPGEVASEIFARVVERVIEAGIPHYKRHHVGHGWGLGGYNPPLIGPRDDTVLEEGMLLCLETPYYEVGFGGLMVEDVIVVEEKGPRFLTHFNRKLLSLS